jgi:hypothetical protein
MNIETKTTERVGISKFPRASNAPAHSRFFSKLVLPVGLLCLAGGPALAQQGNDNGPNVISFAITRLIIEYNATDEDVGVQVFLDGGSYKRLKAFRPDGRKILDIRGESSLQQQGLTELFFESSEPSLAEVPLDVFLARFPEGEYEFEGEGIDGVGLEGEVMFTHVIPAGPFLISPAEGTVVDPNNTVIMWEPVTETIDGSTDLEIIGYQVIVATEDPSRLANVRAFNVEVPADVTSVTVSPEFLDPDTEYEWEVLAIEAGGNQTLSSSTFTTAP